MTLEPQAPKANRTRAVAGALLGVTLSLCGLIYVFSGVDLDTLAASTGRILAVPLLGAVTLYWIGVVGLRALLVRHLLAAAGEIKTLRAYRCIAIGFLANSVLPFRAGDLVRSAALSRGANISFASVIGSLAIERILDMLMVAILALAAIRFAPLPHVIQSIAFVSIAVFGIMFIILATLAVRSTKSTKRRPMAWAKKLRTNLISGIGTFKSVRGIFIAIILMMGLWGTAIVSIMLRLESFELPGTVPFAVVLLFSIGVGVSLPSAPAYVGVYHAAAVFALELLGVEHSTAAAFGLFSWIIDVSLSCALGGISLIVEGFKLGDLKKL